MTMKKLITATLLALAGLAGPGAVMAQWQNSPQFDRDLHFCSRSHNFDRCMWDRGWQRGHGRRWERRVPNWHQPPPPNWHQPPPPSRNQPRLSDMQRRALENCNFLPPNEQPRCRATVWSTVR